MCADKNGYQRAQLRGFNPERNLTESVRLHPIMPKAPHKKRNGAAKGPYAQAAAKTSAANSIFRMNTDIGQHVLKNPGVAQAIVDKADLKQSDVRAVLLLTG